MGDLYSPGRIVALWRALFLISQQPDGIPVRELFDTFDSRAQFGGSSLVKDSVEIGRLHDLLFFEGGVILVTPLARQDILPLCDSEDPNREVLWKILFVIIKAEKFHWLVFFDRDVLVFKTGIPGLWIDLLEAGGLFNFEDPEVAKWWADLLGEFNRFDDEILKQIGTLGEKLTYEFEIARLNNEKIEHVNHQVRWIAKISESEGYDIKSIRGRKHAGIALDPIYIEVKASVIGDPTQFRFKLSRNEWETAVVNIDSFFFYFWVGVDIGTQSAVDGPFIVSAKRFARIVPVDQSHFARWTETRFNINLLEFR